MQYYSDIYKILIGRPTVISSTGIVGITSLIMVCYRLLQSKLPLAFHIKKNSNLTVVVDPKWNKKIKASENIDFKG